MIVSLAKGDDRVRLVLPASTVEGSVIKARDIAAAEMPDYTVSWVDWRATLADLDVPGNCCPDYGDRDTRSSVPSLHDERCSCLACRGPRPREVAA